MKKKVVLLDWTRDTETIVSMSIQIKPDNVTYHCETTDNILQEFLSKNYHSGCGMSSLNYLKRNAKLIRNQGIIL